MTIVTSGNPYPATRALKLTPAEFEGARRLINLMRGNLRLSLENPSRARRNVTPRPILDTRILKKYNL